ncbi:hypothetical protein MWU75_18285 [Ornithinimicrobium sp. F0845]|uniref:hypothetical protein n=1 Tax=Ornithinimicrobium sp. F0845 TaxID=2926412 RepID=UPI001FF3DBB6|nr:hypothetical protein [Ornithinimicrobium sp. F0845]MCK0114095.1 hypothetical protein [Ornithinimicrobium sp. F0845]
MSQSTLDGVRPASAGPRSLLWRRGGFGLLVLFVAAGVFGFLGDREGVVEGPAADGHHLRLEYAESARPGMDVPFEITVTRPEGLDPEVTLALTGEYLDMFETQGWYPEATEMTRDGEWVYLTFATEGQPVMVIDFDAYIQPNALRARSGELAVVVDGEPVDPLSFRTVLFP